MFRAAPRIRNETNLTQFLDRLSPPSRAQVASTQLTIDDPTNKSVKRPEHLDIMGKRKKSSRKPEGPKRVSYLPSLYHCSYEKNAC